MTPATAAAPAQAVPTPAPPARGSGRLARAVVAVPDRVLMLFFWTSLVVAAAVLLGQFRPVVVLPALLLTAVATWRLVPGRVRADRASVVGTLTAVALAAAWLVLNLPYASRYLVVLRDPGFLTLAGIWLSDNPSPNMPVGAAEAVAAQVPGASPVMAPYYIEDGLLHVQGAKLFPGMIALPGWVFGVEGVLAANLVIGAVGLLTVYGLARRMVGPLWALVPTGALAASVPMTELSRTAYTEPMALVAVMGGLTLAWSAFQTGRWWQLTLAGAMVGSSALARIDGAASVIGLLVGAGLIAGLAVKDEQRRRWWLGTATAVLAAVAMVALGWLDLRLNSRFYLRDLDSQYSQLVTVLALACAGALLLPVRRPWRWLRRFVLHRRKGLALACGALVCLVAVVLISRPWWYVGHDLAPDSGYAQFVANLQGQEGVPVDGTRSYDELSVNWQAWYLGWPTVLLAFAGMAVMTYRAVRRRDPRLAVVVAVIAAPTAMYLWKVSITPDQIWAIRRFLPVTVPGLAIIAVWMLRESVRWVRGRRARVTARAVQAVVAAVVLLFPLTTWGSLARTIEMGGRLEELRTACDVIPDGRVVYVREGSQPYLQTLTTVCGVEAVEFPVAPTREQLAAVREAWGGTPLTVIGFRGDLIPWAREAEAVKETFVTAWPSRLGGLPTDPQVQRSLLWAGTIAEDGSVEPLD